MLELLGNLGGGELIGLVAVLGGMLIAVSAVITSQWRRVRVAELESALKQSMLDKNMSAADISEVMKAGSDSRDKPAFAPRCEDVHSKASLAQRMIDNGYEGEDIERVLRAYEATPTPVEEPVAP